MVQLLIELDLTGELIAGTLRQQPAGDTVPFSGWLQLTETIETIRRSAQQIPSDESTRAPGRESPQTTDRGQ